MLLATLSVPATAAVRHESLKALKRLMGGWLSGARRQNVSFSLLWMESMGKLISGHLQPEIAAAVPTSQIKRLRPPGARATTNLPAEEPVKTKEFFCIAAETRIF